MCNVYKVWNRITNSYIMFINLYLYTLNIIIHNYNVFLSQISGMSEI